jgi:hypothetical protein
VIDSHILTWYNRKKVIRRRSFAVCIKTTLNFIYFSVGGMVARKAQKGQDLAQRHYLGASYQRILAVQGF